MPELTKTFIITSVTYFSNKQLQGPIARSVFTPEERAAQTTRTIESIREKIPGATIVLLEMGREKNIPGGLPGKVDKYVFMGDHPLVKWAVNGKHRGFGEAMGLIVSNKEVNTGADFYFKMSGRYFLDDHFEPGLWRGDFLLARKYGEEISTRLYGFAEKHFPDWQKALRRSLLRLYRGSSIENIFPAKFGRERIHEIKRLGLAGYVAPFGEYLEE